MPSNLTEMIALAEQLCDDVPFCRIDFYNINHLIYFGEYTLFPAAGLCKWTTDDADMLIGSWLKLPKKRILK